MGGVEWLRENLWWINHIHVHSLTARADSYALNKPTVDANESVI